MSNKLTSNKNGQITLFIIIGLIILFSAFFVFYLRDIAIDNTIESRPIVSDVPEWVKPVNEFVLDCMAKVSIKGFKSMGEHGGFIDMQNPQLIHSQFSFNDNPIESDAVMLSSDTFSPVPYWWYLKSPTDCINCTMSYLIPSIPVIGAQMDRLLELELETCLNNFESFKNEKFEIETGTVVSKTSINLHDVDIHVTYPLNIKKGDDRFEMSDFFINLDLNIRDIYNLALFLTDHQINSQVLEDITTHLIGRYSSANDPTKLPPIAWADSRSDITTWKKDEVKDRLKYLLGSYIPSIQVNNTRNAQHIIVSDPLEQGVYDVMFLKFLSINYPDLSINFFYDPSWPIHFDITPRSGQILSPSTVRSEFPFNLAPSIQRNYYEFYYDLAYPVIVIIRDNESLRQSGEEGYTFMFALEVNIRDNKNLKLWNQGNGTLGVFDYSGASIDHQSSTTPTIGNCTGSDDKWICLYDGRLFNGESPCLASDCKPGNCTFHTYETWTCPLDSNTYSDEVTCGSKCKEEERVYSNHDRATEQETLFCDEPQRISNEITIRSFDAKTRNPLPNVPLTFGCGNYKECPIGSTDDAGVFTGRLPLCIGDGHLYLEKQNYISKYTSNISITLTSNEDHDILLEPIREKTVKVHLINVTSLFRIKRWLRSDTGSGVLRTIYWKLLQRYAYSVTEHRNVPLYAEYGLLGEIEEAITALMNQTRDVEDYELTKDEIGLLTARLNASEDKIVRFSTLIENFTHFTNVDMELIVDITHETKNIVEMAWKILHDKSYLTSIIGSRFTGNISIEAGSDQLLRNTLVLLNKELENEQFLRDDELNLAANIYRYRTTSYPLREQDTATITYGKIKESIFEQDNPTPITQVGYGQNSTIKLVPGRYDVNIVLRDERGLNIPATGAYPSISYPTAMMGGIVLNNITGFWELTQSQLDSSSTIQFFVLKLDDMTHPEDLGELSELENYSRRYRSYIDPGFLP